MRSTRPRLRSSSLRAPRPCARTEGAAASALRMDGRTGGAVHGREDRRPRARTRGPAALRTTGRGGAGREGAAASALRADARIGSNAHGPVAAALGTEERQPRPCARTRGPAALCTDGRSGVAGHDGGHPGRRETIFLVGASASINSREEWPMGLRMGRKPVSGRTVGPKLNGLDEKKQKFYFFIIIK